jgi:mono/diheme cytochrome c family protein
MKKPKPQPRAAPPPKDTPARPATVAKVSATVTTPVADDVEPTAADRPLPALAFGVLAALLFWGDMYVMNHGADLMGRGGSFPEELYDPIDSYASLELMHPKKAGSLFDDGRLAYQKYCQACHQPGGLGQPGMFPPLAGSDWVLADGPNRLIRIVLDGLTGPITVNGQQFNNVMVPWRDTIQDDRELAAVLTYVRNEWGNKASEVPVEKITQVREATKNRTGRPWTAPELLQIPVAD